MHRIYLTTNLVNGKKYVGRCSKDSRWDSGYIGSGKLLKQAILKYGYENFKREILEELPDTATLREAIDLEKSWLLKLDCKNSLNFYNVSDNTGGMGSGDKHSEQTKEKISKKMKELYGDTGLPATWRKNVVNAIIQRVPWNKGKTGYKKSSRKTNKRFTYEEFLIMKEEYDMGIPAYKLGIKYGCSHHTILKLVRNGFKQEPIEEVCHPRRT
jgi:group I intron endonuclease